MKSCYSLSFLKSIFLVLTLILFTALAHATTQTVTVQNKIFTPSSFTINFGDTVKWVWVNGSHTTTSTTLPAGANSWNHNINSSPVNTSFIYVPNVLGTFNYKCTPHSSEMQGTFTVVCGTPAVTISAGGPTTFCAGESVVLSKSSIANYPTYQWQKNGTDISGEMNTSTTATTSGSYTLIVTNSCSNTATSNAIQVTKNAKPAATVTPSGTVDKCAADHVILSVSTGQDLKYKWKKDGTGISGATNSTLDVVAAGSYKVTVTNSVTGCKKTSKATVVNNVCRTGVEQTIKAYPNPTKDYFTFSASQLEAGSIITIYDLSGKILETHVFSGDDIKAGKGLPSGVYIASILVGSEVKEVIKLAKHF